MNLNIKIYFNIMYIVMLVVGILWCCTIVGALWGVPMIIGSQAMKKARFYDEKQLKENNTALLVWAIIFGVFTIPAGAIAIVFGVLVYNFISEGKSEGEVIIDLKSEESKSVDKITKKLSELETLRKNETITEEEYNAMRKKILDL